MKSSLKNFWQRLNLPSQNEIKASINSFSKRDYFIFVGAILTLTISLFAIIYKIDNKYSIKIPAYGGILREGVIGTPRFINPLLAVSDSDKDMATIIYSGLMKKDIYGTLIPDLASSYEISKDETTYTFILRDNIYFHDNNPVTADDILFVIQSAKDSLIKSPRQINWQGINVEKVDEKTIKFILKQPYASFLENTTLGILPAHLWKKVPPNQWSLSELNINPIGSGPYKVASIEKNSGIPTSYKLISFSKYSGGRPYIKNMYFNFYDNENDLISAFKNNDVDNINSISPNNAQELEKAGFKTVHVVLPRIFGVFFNSSQAPIFTDKAIIKAFEKTINKKAIIDEVLFGYGRAINSPLPPNMIEYASISSEDSDLSTTSADEAIAILEKSGWKLGENGIRQKEKLTVISQKTGKKTTAQTTKENTELSFSLSTSDIPELKQVAEMIKQDLEKIGAQVDLKIFENGNLNQNVIRPRQYEALFFGQVINKESDLFAFWHSSQRNDPGLNIAMYANPKVDKSLEALLTSINLQDRAKKYLDFQTEIEKDSPSIFIHSPEFTYVLRKNIKGLIINDLRNPQDRFANISNWYIKSDSIWKIFTKN